MTITCRHKLATAELQWDNMLLRCTICTYEEIAARCFGVMADRSRCPAPVSDPEYLTCERHGDQEPPRWGPAR
ncbi:MAG TPA: hypothetical protein VIK06_06585 [Candidatus Limnocylindrales bacterium]